MKNSCLAALSVVIGHNKGSCRSMLIPLKNDRRMDRPQNNMRRTLPATVVGGVSDNNSLGQQLNRTGAPVDNSKATVYKTIVPHQRYNSSSISQKRIRTATNTCRW